MLILTVEKRSEKHKTTSLLLVGREADRGGGEEEMIMSCFQFMKLENE